jgi:glycosyltransferase involved in cell wall biosynthesis
LTSACDSISRQDDIIIVDDGSDEDYISKLKNIDGVNLVLSDQNNGIAVIKNKCLSLFNSNIDIIYLMDDDIELLPNWEEEYRKALLTLPLISFYDPLYRHNDYANSGFLYNAENMSCFNCCHGAMVAVTKACWQVIGDYTVFPDKYGGEHQEYYYRAAIAGLVPIEGFYDVKDSARRLINLFAGDEKIQEKEQMTANNLRSDQWNKTEIQYTKILNGYKSMKKLKIGIDLDGTLYSHPEFFGAMLTAMVADGHEFYCISSHSRLEWYKDERKLRLLGINPELIKSDMMYDERHGHIHLKAKQADTLDFIFDDDFRVQALTNTPQFCPLKGGNAKVSGDKVIYE